jgi:hypothetical protein
VATGERAKAAMKSATVLIAAHARRAFFELFDMS